MSAPVYCRDLPHIDTDVCIRCHSCVRECPSKVFSVGDDKAVSVKAENDCISCGHCAAVCPPGAISMFGGVPERLPNTRY
ncbi:hypothetical protein KIPB_000062 [Kipferlia bialata]|uniref:4Fe-4S ferredoxin-type domain-containing protein n=1 Tax=Kipferlia bialata TaxID=797122 RepID=A0A9K3CNM7_9EUKA|nr:hypothetical protein KIPB_000062 [Kipferlia bialata]|eukprot:g62.t1